MKKVLLAGALLALASCSKDSSNNVTVTPSYRIPYWSNAVLKSPSQNEQLTTAVKISGYDTSDHLSLNGVDYKVMPIDSITGAATTAAAYHGHKLSIIGNGVSLTGTYQIELSDSTIVLTVDPSSSASPFGNNMYLGTATTKPLY